MPYATIENSNITKDQLVSIFENGFHGRCDVYASKLPAVDLVVRKSAFTGVAVRLKRHGGEARLRYAAFTPSTMVRALGAGGLLWYFLMWSSWRAITADVKSFIESSPELSGDTAPPADEPNAPATTEVGPRHGVAAVFMGITALIVPIIMGLSFFGDFWLGEAVYVTAALTAVAGFVASKVIKGSGHGMTRGALVAIGAWLVGQLSASMVYWSPSGEIAGWFTTYGMVELALVAAAGVVMAVLTRALAPAMPQPEPQAASPASHA